VFDKKTNRLLNLNQLSEQKWDELFGDRMSADKGTLQGADEGRFLLNLKNGTTIPVTFKYNIEIETTYHYNRVSLKECKGLLDEDTGDLITDRLETSPLVFKDIMKTWPSTKNQEEIPFKSVLYLWVVQRFSKEHENIEAVVLHASISPPTEAEAEASASIFQGKMNGLKVR
jgi:hypothetical protein